MVKPDRTDEDIIFEMMLKRGLELTLPIEKVDAAGYTCYSVAYGELVCCLVPGLNEAALPDAPSSNSVTANQAES